MRVHDDVDDDEEERDMFNGKAGKLVPASRFGCNDIYLRYCFYHNQLKGVFCFLFLIYKVKMDALMNL